MNEEKNMRKVITELIYSLGLSLLITFITALLFVVAIKFILIEDYFPATIYMMMFIFMFKNMWRYFRW